MANASISGLVSGLDTATIISQLMQLEARPQTMLKSRVSTAERAVTALQTFNSKLANLATKAGDLTKLSAWSPTKATSDNEAVTVKATNDAVTGSLSFNIIETATATTRSFTTAMSRDATAAAATTLTIDHVDPSSTDVSLTLTDTTLEGVAAALNDPANDTGVTATLVRAGGSDTDPTYRLVVTSKATGADSGFTIDDGSGTFLGGSSANIPQDATINVNGSDLTSASNTFTGLMPGVDVTLSADATGPATITVSRDSQSLADKVKSLVDAINGALTEADSLGKSGANAKDRGLLSGDPTLRQVRNELLQAVTYGVGGKSLATYGISTDRSGKLVFDEAKFKEAYAADPTKTAQMFAAPEDPAAPGAVTGFAAAVEKLGKAFSNSTDGMVTTAVKSRQASIKGWEDDIADWDVRLETKRTALQRQYTALESALGKLQSQGNWLAGQLASLPQMSSGQ